MAVSLTADVQQRAKASSAGRFLGTGTSDVAPFPWRELTGAEGHTILGLETVTAVPLGIGYTGDLMSAWVSGFGVTGSSPVTGVTESHGIGTPLTVTGAPTLQSDGAIRVISNGATSTSLLIKPIPPDLLTTRNILVMDVNQDIAGDWVVSSIFRAFNSNTNYGFHLNAAGITIYTAGGPLNYGFTPKRGRQRIGLYIQFGTVSKFCYISVGRDQNSVARPPFKVTDTFSTSGQDPTGENNLDVWVGEGNLIAGRAGTHDIYGWRLLRGVPAGQTDDSIDALLMAEIKKIERDSDPQLRLPAVLASAFAAGNPAVANQDMDGNGFFAVGQVERSVSSTTDSLVGDDRGKLVRYTGSTCAVTIASTLPSGHYDLEHASAGAVTVTGGSTVTLIRVTQSAITSPIITIDAGGRLSIECRNPTGTDPFIRVWGDITATQVLNDDVQFGAKEAYGNLSPFQNATGSQATAASGRSWKLTANITAVPIANGWHATYVNTSGSSKTITPGSGGSCVKLATGATVTSVTVNDDKGCSVKGDGTNLIVFGDVT